VLARYGLARAFALSGNTDKARQQYRKFLAAWTAADPDVPMFRQATIEDEYPRITSWLRLRKSEHQPRLIGYPMRV
jgi:hypothetical protein